MKKHIGIFILALCTHIVTLAQITLTENNAVVTNDTIFSYHVYQTINNYSFLQTGENKTWDFSDYELNDTTTFFYIQNPTSADFPTAQLSESDMYMQSINYFTHDNNGLYLIGQKISGYLFDFDTKRPLLRFPLTYNSSFTGNFACTIDVNSLTYEREGTYKIASPSYGSLLLPGKTIDNVLSVYTTYTYSDTYNGYDMGYTVVDTIYTWYSELFSTYVAAYTVSYNNGSKYLESFCFMSIKEPTDIPEISTKESIGYLDSKNMFFITKTNDLQSIHIYNLHGVSAMNPIIKSNSSSIDLSALKPGIYLIEASTMKNCTYIQKVYVQ